MLKDSLEDRKITKYFYRQIFDGIPEAQPSTLSTEGQINSIPELSSTKARIRNTNMEFTTEKTTESEKISST